MNTQKTNLHNIFILCKTFKKEKKESMYLEYKKKSLFV